MSDVPQPGDVWQHENGEGRRVLRLLTDDGGRQHIMFSNGRGRPKWMTLGAWRCWCKAGERLLAEPAEQAATG